MTILNENFEEYLTKYSELFNDVKHKYDYLNIDNQEYEIECIRIVKESFNKEYLSYEEYLYSELSNFFINKIIYIFRSNDDSVANLIGNYIDSRLLDNCDYPMIINQLDVLHSFLNAFNYTLSYDVAFNLINNFKIKKYLETIFELNKYEIINNEYNYSNDTISTLMKIFCEINEFGTISNNRYEDISLSDLNEDFEKKFLREIKKMPLLSEEEFLSLFIKSKKGDIDARNTIINRNLKLVVFVIKHYFSNESMSFLDMLQEGSIGLMKAIEKYDYSKNTKFSTYAVTWIRQAIYRSIANKNRIIRLPQDVYQQVGKYKKCLYQLEEQLHRKPTRKEIAKRMNLSLDDIDDLEINSSSIGSLNISLIDDYTDDLQDYLQDFNINIEDDYNRDDLCNRIDYLIENSNLTEREKNILYIRFGFFSYDTHTLKETGKLIGLSEERVRQIESRAISKIIFNDEINSIVNLTTKPDAVKDIIARFKSNYAKYKTYSLNDLKIKTNEELKRESILKNKNIYQLFKGSLVNIRHYLKQLELDKLLILDKVSINGIESLNLTENIIYYGNILYKFYNKKVQKLNSLENCDDLTDEETIRIVSLLKSGNLSEYTNYFGNFDALILFLKLGFFENKIFSDSSISNKLGVKCESIKEVMNLYNGIDRETIENYFEFSKSVKNSNSKKHNIEK